MWSKKVVTDVVQNFMKQLMFMVLILLLSFGARVQAELEEDLKAVTKDGRQVRLNRDYTWEFIQFVEGDPSNSAVLTVTQVWDMQDACKLQFRLQNNLGYKIHATGATLCHFEQRRHCLRQSVDILYVNHADQK